MIIRPGKAKNKRFESMKGNVMIDVVNGAIRVRRWPRKRPGPKSPEQTQVNDQFAQAQRAFDFLAPAQITTFYEQTKGTPILPRDLMTAMMFGKLFNIEMEDGRTIYPMSTRNQTSEALDTISQTPGDLLIRGEDTWEPIAFPTLPGWNMLASQVISVATPEIIITGLGGFQDIIIALDNMVPSVSGFQFARVSTDNAASFYTALGDYRDFAISSATTVDNGIPMTVAATAGTRSSFLQVVNSPAGVKNCWMSGTGRPFGYLVPSTDPITDIKVYPTAGVWNAGTIFALGR